MIKIALLGAGVIGREHAGRMGGQVDCALHSVTDPSPAGRAYAAERGVPHHATLDALLGGPLPDAAIVATPNDLHVPQALALVRRGVPVLIEKPVADTLPAGAELVRAVQDTGIPVLVGHHRRHSAVLQAAHACLRAGELGRLVAVNTSVLFHKPAAYFQVEWRRQPGGGPILINLVHEIDTLRWLAGEVVAVQARASSATRGFAVEDSAAVLLEFASGALGTLIVSDAAASPRSWEQTSGENPAYARDDSQDCLFLAGTQGSLALPTMTRWLASGPASWHTPMQRERLTPAAVDPLVRQLQHFCDVIRGRAEPLVSAADALASLRVTLAVHEAATTGLRVPLPHSPLTR
ncbi:MAG: Gfo/Idh/MocA family protein [Leptothrix sp. (in: b-proteobacteria)]